MSRPRDLEERLERALKQGDAKDRLVAARSSVTVKCVYCSSKTTLSPIPQSFDDVPLCHCGGPMLAVSARTRRSEP